MSNFEEMAQYFQQQLAFEEEENKKLRKENESASNLLAIIHRDGGHYQTKHGTVKSIKDAIKIWHDLRNQLEQANEDAERLYKHARHLQICNYWDSNGALCSCGAREVIQAHEERISNDTNTV